MDKDITKIYNKVTENDPGVKFPEIVYLGLQVESGTNYTFLNLATIVSEEKKLYCCCSNI